MLPTNPLGKHSLFHSLLIYMQFVHSSIINQASARTFIYDISKDSWKEGPGLNQERLHHDCAALTDNQGRITAVLVAGGSDPPNGSVKTTEILQVNEGTWTYGATFITSVGGGSRVVRSRNKNFMAYVLAGYGSSKIYGLNRTTNAWQVVGNTKEGHYNFDAVLV